MLPQNTIAGIAYALIFGLSIFGNVIFILYLVINKVKTSVDKLILNLSIIELVVVVSGVPFVNDVWFGEPYKYGSFGCKILVPFHSICDFAEAFVLIVMAIFVAEKLKGDDKHRNRVFTFVAMVYLSAAIMNVPYFGVETMQKRLYKQKSVYYCVEDWNSTASALFKVMRVIIQFVVPLFALIFFYRQSWKIIAEMRHCIGTKKAKIRYQSFSKVVADNNDHSQAHYLRFTESEEMNLEMNQIYQQENSLARIEKDAETSSVSVQIFTNEVTIEKITSLSPLWKGKKPDTKWKQENEFQKLILSIKWFKYTANLFNICSAVSVVFLLSILPNQVMTLYSLSKSRYEFGPIEKSISQILVCMRYMPGVVNPWLFLFGIVKFRRNICKCNCKRRCCC